MNIRQRTQDTCTCKSYHFPHRLASGACVAKQPGPYCGDCGQPCEAIRADFGIGAYEYWGSKGTHSDIHTVSRCCEAPVYDDASLTIEHEYEPD